MHRVEIRRVAQRPGQSLRKAERNRELTAGFFARDDRSVPLGCLIRDVSEGGAQIRINAAEPILGPGYIVNLKARSVQEARVVWRRGSLTGLSLGKKYGIGDQLPGPLEFLGSFFEAMLRQVDQISLEAAGAAAALRDCGGTQDRRARGPFLH